MSAEAACTQAVMTADGTTNPSERGRAASAKPESSRRCGTVSIARDDTCASPDASAPEAIIAALQAEVTALQDEVAR
jgi:hypothetical protein